MFTPHPPCRCMIYGGTPAPQPDAFDELVAGDPELVVSLATLDALFVAAT